MPCQELPRTAELIRCARETCRRTHDIIEELNRVRDEVEETVSSFRWQRFLGYDVKTFEFVDKLDARH
jgi:hypothetical protein